MITTAIVPRDAIQRYADQIVTAFQPETIILFGSYAYGSPSSNSDVDLLVLLPRAEDPINAAVAIRQRVPASFPVDLLVRTPQQFASRLALGDPFSQEIVQRGTILYANAHS